jgi:hypothetical protein
MLGYRADAMGIESFGAFVMQGLGIDIGSLRGSGRTVVIDWMYSVGGWGINNWK